MLRLVTGRTGTLRLNIYDEDGTPVDPATAPTVTITTGSGTEIQTGTATETDTTGVWTFIASAAVTDELDEYEATWEYELDSEPVLSVITFQVAAAHTFEIADLRAANPALADTTEYPADKIKRARVDAEERFERGAQLAMVRRARRVTIIGEGYPKLLLPDSEVQEILAIEIDGTTLDVSDPELQLDTQSGILEHPYKWEAGAVIDLYYIHGLNITPEPVSRAIRTLAIEYLVPSGLPARATSQSTDLGEFRIQLAGKDGTTGIPEVDSVMMDFGRRRPATGATRA